MQRSKTKVLEAKKPHRGKEEPHRGQIRDMWRPKQRYTEVKGHTEAKKSHAEAKSEIRGGQKQRYAEAKMEICKS